MLDETIQMAPPASSDLGQTNPLVTVPMTEDQRKKWRGDIDRANTKRKIFEPAWERNLKAYTPDPSNEKWGDEINPGVDFYQVEQKKAQLFFDTPEVILTADAGADPAAVLAQQQVLNRTLGRHELNTKRLIDKVLMDILCPSGVGCTKLGLTQITKDVPMPADPQADPNAPPQTAPVPVYSKVFWERFSPKQWLNPSNFHDTEFDKAPWQGVKFKMPLRSGRRAFNLPADFNPKASTSADQTFQYAGVKDQTSDDEEITGEEIWYYAALYDDAVYHPEQMRQLVFVDGLEDPVVHRDSPYQTFENGAFTPDSLIGNPIHLFTIRDLPDSAYVPSDCTITRPLVNELSRFRTQLVEMRDASTPIRVADETVITNAVLEKITRGPVGTILRIPNYDPNRPPVMMVAPPVYQRDNFTSQDKIEGDLNKVNALSANQVGTEQDTVRSATELTYVQKNADVRLQAERNRVIGCFLAGVRKLDALLKRYPAQPGQAPPLGPYSYDIKPDSGVHVDAKADRQFFEQAYNLLAKDPNINRMALLKALLPLIRLDPTAVIVQPPPPGPPPPKTSLIVRGEDLNPLAPQYPNVVQAMAQLGVKLVATPITPSLVDHAATVQAAKQPVHPGSPPKPDVVNQHTADESGQMQHFGGQAGGVQ